jgi:hypothetical protein
MADGGACPWTCVWTPRSARRTSLSWSTLERRNAPAKLKAMSAWPPDQRVGTGGEAAAKQAWRAEPQGEGPCQRLGAGDAASSAMGGQDPRGYQPPPTRRDNKAYHALSWGAASAAGGNPPGDEPISGRSARVGESASAETIAWEKAPVTADTSFIMTTRTGGRAAPSPWHPRRGRRRPPSTPSGCDLHQFPFPAVQ